MNEINEYSQQGDVFRQYVTQRIGEELFKERRKRGQTITQVSRLINVNTKFVDRMELGTSKIRWTIMVLLLKYYRKKIEIKLVDMD